MNLDRGPWPLMTSMLIALALLNGCAGPATTPSSGNVWSPHMEAKRMALVSATADSGIAVLRSKSNELQANVPSDFSFDTDSALIKPRMKIVLDNFAADLNRPDFARMLIRVVGHTDSRGPEMLNESLSLARANSVARYLETKGVAPERIRVEGRGEREPVIGNELAMTRALNRRVEMFLREPSD